MIKNYTFSSNIPGKNILILWCVHWNEICWQKAIDEIISLFNEKKLNVISGTVTFIPIANPKAFQENKRYIDVNLNRVFTKHENPKNYEENLANELTNFIDKSDILLDIHSTHSDDEPFVFLDYDDEENNLLAKSCLLENIVVWWPEIYKNTQNWDSCSYTHFKNKIWVTMECWNHNSPKSVEIWKKAIINILATYKIIDKIPENLTNFNKIKVESFIIKEFEWVLTKNYNHLDNFV